ncbi:sensor domain-containing diguanylate cyclase [Roseateles sp. SL47]|uniref:GGDEF domain-containing protein n=1 Tax=Roseateles sp. SL47 TaxID=2995138 RepID=UPI002D1E3ED8|nr:sensor domain-containing diguanylate cyclase [Roseateles sp. SL47]
MTLSTRYILDALIAQLSSTVPTARNLEQLTRPLLDMLGAVTGLESTYLTSVDERGGQQQVRLARNAGSLQIPEGLVVAWEDTLCKRALDEGVVACSDVPERWGDSEPARRLGIQTYVSTPVRTEDGALMGTLCAASAQRQEVRPEALSVLTLFSSLVGQFIERERLVEELRAANEQLATFALTDPLTGLPNRRALFDELQRLIQRASRDGSSLLVGCIDLDGFKAINDRLGHQAGDRFLQEVAQRLSLEMRGSDMLARMGGDEFVVVGPGVDLRARPASSGPSLDHADALQAAHTLEQRASLATVGRFELDGQFVQYGGASVGVVPLNPVGLTAEEALQLADARMYEVKRARQQQRLATADVAS